MKPYFDCPTCKRRYAPSEGSYIETKNKKKRDCKEFCLSSLQSLIDTMKGANILF